MHARVLLESDATSLGTLKQMKTSVIHVVCMRAYYMSLLLCRIVGRRRLQDLLRDGLSDDEDHSCGVCACMNMYVHRLICRYVYMLSCSACISV